ncbi:MAG: hypothetical protein L6Q95_01750 [Planctomycetes bacterium]|nr:hypothetical protein [Planctomycetota bacterium]
MGAEAAVEGASRLEAFLREVLRNTWLSIVGLALAVVGDTLAPRLGPAQLLVFVGFLVSAVGFVASLRAERLGCLVGSMVLAIRVWSALVTLLLAMGHIMVP